MSEIHSSVYHVKLNYNNSLETWQRHERELPLTLIFVMGSLYYANLGDTGFSYILN